MAPRRKQLAELCRDRSFLRRRHEQLLLHDRVDDPALRALQRRYQDAAGDAERRELALQFERAVRQATVEPLPLTITPTASRQPQLTATAMLYAGIGPYDPAELGFRQADGLIDFDGFEALVRRWIYWNSRHGTW